METPKIYVRRDQAWWEKFVEVWQSSASATRVAEIMGVRVEIARAMARNARKKGVPLKRMPKTSVKINWQELAKKIS